jgi:hypothetical protein
MLLTMRALTEGCRALSYWVGMELDISPHHPDEKRRQEADDLVALLTPIVKSFLTDHGFNAANLGVQVFGGHGFIREWGMEQLVRDARITQIYEGTNGVQAMDLIGRKLPKDGGRAIQAFFRLVGEEVELGKRDGKVVPVALALEKALQQLQAATMWLMQNAMTNPNNAGAAAYAYMHIMGIVALGLMWLKMARAANALLIQGASNSAYLEAKLVTARYFAERIMPDAGALRRKIEGGADALMALAPEDFLTAA